MCQVSQSVGNSSQQRNHWVVVVLLENVAMYFSNYNVLSEKEKGHIEQCNLRYTMPYLKLNANYWNDLGYRFTGIGVSWNSLILVVL